MPDWDAHICPDCANAGCGRASQLGIVAVPVLNCVEFRPKNCLRSTLEVLDMAGDPLEWPISERPLIYVAAYYTANPAHGMRTAIEAYKCLTELGWVAWVPHTSFLLDVVAPNTPEAWYSYDLALLRRCDAMYVCQDALTEQSTGVQREIEYAKKHDIPIFTTLVAAKDRYKEVSA